MKKDIYLSKKYKSFLYNNNITNHAFLIKIDQKDYKNFYKTKLYKKTKKIFQKK